MTADFDPNEDPPRCQAYLSHTLGRPLRFVLAERLEKGSPPLPWRLDAEEAGGCSAYALYADWWRANHEYEVLQALQEMAAAPGPAPAPRVYGRDLGGSWLGVPCFLRRSRAARPGHRSTPLSPHGP